MSVWHIEIMQVFNLSLQYADDMQINSKYYDNIAVATYKKT